MDKSEHLVGQDDFCVFANRDDATYSLLTLSENVTRPVTTLSRDDSSLCDADLLLEDEAHPSVLFQAEGTNGGTRRVLLLNFELPTSFQRNMASVSPRPFTSENPPRSAPVIPPRAAIPTREGSKRVMLLQDLTAEDGVDAGSVPERVEPRPRPHHVVRPGTPFPGQPTHPLRHLPTPRDPSPVPVARPVSPLLPSRRLAPLMRSPRLGASMEEDGPFSGDPPLLSRSDFDLRGLHVASEAERLEGLPRSDSVPLHLRGQDGAESPAGSGAQYCRMRRKNGLRHLSPPLTLAPFPTDSPQNDRGIRVSPLGDLSPFPGDRGPSPTFSPTSPFRISLGGPAPLLHPHPTSPCPAKCKRLTKLSAPPHISPIPTPCEAARPRQGSILRSKNPPKA